MTHEELVEELAKAIRAKLMLISKDWSVIAARAALEFLGIGQP
jgi:hypothetical protein